MDLEKAYDVGVNNNTTKPHSNVVEKGKGVGNYKLNLESFDIQLEKQWSRIYSKTVEKEKNQIIRVASEFDSRNLLDVQLQKQWNKVFSWNDIEKVEDNQKKKKEGDINLLKLNVRSNIIITQGDYGTVYKGTYDSQDVAVKLLVAETKIATFQTQIGVLHKLNHPNVTKYVGASMTICDHPKIPTENSSDYYYRSIPARAKPYCVVVEYPPGNSETLKQYLERYERKKLSFKIVIQLALDLAKGLSYLHSQKIVHRDVKTENMLLDGQRALKIAEFGVGLMEAQSLKDMSLAYMAPEVLDGKPYRRSCDVYSFGICLWEIYCCKMPYRNLRFVGEVREKLPPYIPPCCQSS